MALINKKHVVERETASYKLDRSTLELVKGYAEYIDSPHEYVVNQALLYLFSKDKDFKEWLKANDKHDLAAKPAALAKGKRREANGSSLSVTSITPDAQSPRSTHAGWSSPIGACSPASRSSARWGAERPAPASCPLPNKSWAGGRPFPKSA